jgi:hypothetical protein
LGQSGLEVFDDFGGDDVGIGKIGAVFEALKARPRLFGLSYGVVEASLRSSLNSTALSGQVFLRKRIIRKKMSRLALARTLA